MKFGENLMLIRKRKGYSQEDLAAAINVSRQTIYSWEAELNYPNIIMLKNIAETLGVTTDDLISGYDVSQFPDNIGKIEVNFVKKHSGPVFYNELPNWFVKLSAKEEVCFALYDDGKRDYSYHLYATNKITLHNEEGLEVVVDEYDPHLNHSRTYTSFVQVKDDEVFFIGQIYQKDGIKHFETFKDKEFLKNWGIGGKNVGQKMIYDNAEDYVLTYNGKKIDVVKLFYFDSDGSSDDKHTYFEVFLNQKGESLYWRRSTKNLKSRKSIEIDGEQYEFDYECITSRTSRI